MGFKTTGVRLIANLSQFKREMREGGKATRDLKDDIQNVGVAGQQMGDDLGRAAQGSAKDFEVMRQHVADLDKQIFTAKRNLATLAMSYNAGNNNEGVLKVIKEQQRQLKELTSVRNLLPKPAEMVEAGASMGRSVRLGFMSVARPIAVALGSVVAGAAAYALPFLGATVSGAVIGGAGLGGVVGGLFLAAKDPRVQAAAKLIGDRLLDRLTRAASGFVGPALQGMQIIEQAIGRIDVEGIFKDSAKFVAPLAQGLAHMIDQLGSGLRGLVAAAGPAIDQMANGLAEIGDAIGDVMRSLSDNGIEAAVALRQVFSIVAVTIRGVGAAINGLTEAYGFLAKLGVFGRDAQLSYLALEASTKAAARAAREYNTEVQNITRVTDPATGAVRRLGSGTFAAARETDNLAGSLSSSKIAVDVAKAAEDALATQYRLSTNATRGQTSALKELSTSLRAQIDPAFALIVAQNNLKKAQDASSAAIKKHGVNSNEARAATRNLALAALDLQGKAGNLAAGFDGRLTPAMRTTFKAAGLTKSEINNVEREMIEAKKAGDKYAKNYRAHAYLDGMTTVNPQLDALLIKQRALQSGFSLGSAKAALQKDLDRTRTGKYAEGGWTGPGHKHQPAGIVHADEFVINKRSRRSIEHENPGLLQEMNATGQVPPGYAVGGQVTWPYRVNVRGTKIPTWASIAAKIMPSFGNWPSSPGAQRGDSGVWRRIVALIKSTGPMSGHFGNAYRPGDPLWHGSGRAVDWMGFNQDRLATFLAARRPLELIHRTNRRDYAYTRGRNKGSFNNSLMQAHRNHVHIAMAGGGVIREPVLGVGASGASYSFGERGPEVVLPTNSGAGGGGTTTVINLNVNLAAGANIREAGRQIAGQLSSYLSGGGSVVVRGSKVLG